MIVSEIQSNLIRSFTSSVCCCSAFVGFYHPHTTFSSRNNGKSHDNKYTTQIKCFVEWNGTNNLRGLITIERLNIFQLCIVGFCFVEFPNLKNFVRRKIDCTRQAKTMKSTSHLSPSLFVIHTSNHA